MHISRWWTEWTPILLPGLQLILLDRYYVLIIACVFARKAEWLRKACLAAALLFPAIASLHAVVLAAVHVNGTHKIASRPGVSSQLTWSPQKALSTWTSLELSSSAQ